MATAAPSSRLSLSSVGINTSGSEGYYKSNLDLVLKENKQLKQRLDQLEKENRGLKKAVYDLSVRYRMDLSLSQFLLLLLLLRLPKLQIFRHACFMQEEAVEQEHASSKWFFQN
jgi:hypothetical protein